MTPGFSTRLIVTGALGLAAIALSPAAGITGHAQTFSCGNIFGGNCPINSGNGNNATSNQTANQTANVNTNSNATATADNNSIAQSFSDPTTTIIQVQAQGAVNNNGANSLNTETTGHRHAVNVNGRSFLANGGGGSFVSLGVGGASNTGGAPLAP